MLVLLLFSLAACDKVKKTEKTLTGVWTLFQYKYTNSLGLKYYYPVSGTMDFGTCGGATCQYSLRADYLKDGSLLKKYEDGTLNLSDDGESFTMDRLESDGSITHIDDGGFLLMTKDDIKLLFIDENGGHEFILQR
jgi:hypothetical protein